MSGREEIISSLLTFLKLTHNNSKAIAMRMCFLPLLLVSLVMKLQLSWRQHVLMSSVVIKCSFTVLQSCSL